jgi:hypothetical protein
MGETRGTVAEKTNPFQPFFKTDRAKSRSTPSSNRNDRANRGIHEILIAIAGFPTEIVLSANQNRDVFYRNKGIHGAIVDPCDRKDTAMLLKYEGFLC